MKNKVLIITLLSFIVICFINYMVYALITQKIPGADVNLEARGIETPLKLLVSGYFGLFFGFKYLGTINWLIIPVFLIYLKVVKPVFKREQKALLAVFLFSFILVSLKGYFNARYQLTLVPFLLFFLFLLTWKIYSHLNNPYYLREITMLFLLALVMQFTYYTLFGSRAQQHIETIFGDKKIVQKETTTYKTVLSVVDYIDSLPDKETFLVNNLPEFYYHTNKKGHYYWCFTDDMYTSHGLKHIFSNRTVAKAKSLLIDSLNCHYIYTIKSYNEYSPQFKQFLEKECTHLVQDSNNAQLYKINE